MRAEEFFTDTEKKRIEETIKEVETTTAGEVAVMVVDRSDAYPEAGLLAGLLFGGLTALLLSDLFFADSLWYFIPLLAAGTAIFSWCALRIPNLLRPFIGGARLEETVRNRALLAFYEKGLYKTRDDTGVLFFLSLLEHKVWVLADEGIYRRITPEELQEYAGSVAAAVKEGRAAEELCREIERVGKVLAEHFPIKPDDRNELSNKVMTAAS